MTLLAVLLAAIPGVARGQLSDFDRSRLAGEIEAAAQNLDPNLFPDLEESKSELLGRVESVKQYFGRATDPENRDAWLAYLDLDPLVDAIESDKSPVALAREAIDLRYRLIGTAPGLELTALRSLRDDVEQLVEAVRYRDKEKSIASLSKQLQSLADRVRELNNSPSADDFAAISAVTGLVESSGQAKGLIRSMRNTFNRPNVAILVGQPMVQTAVGRNVNETRPVRDCILGTRIVGDATITGVVTANLLPAVGAARVNMNLVCHVVSRSIGYNGPVRLRTVGYGDVNVSRSLTFNESGVVALEPIYAQAALRTEIKAIEHKLRLVRKIAKKKAAEQKPKAERIGAEKMRRQVAAQFASQIDETAAVAPPDVLAEVRPVLNRLSLEEPSRIWGSTDQALFIDTTFRRHDQLASVVPRPPISEAYDAAVQIHESVIDNAFAPVLAGRTLKENQLNELLKEAGRPVPAKTDDEGEPEPPFEIDFTRLRPIIFEARDQTLRLGVRGTRFAQGNRELKQAMEITAVYQPAKTNEGVALLLRQGDVDVDFPGRKRLSVSQAGLKRTIQKKFSDVFPEVVLDRPLEVPADVELEAIKGRVFHPRLVDARDGWLTITVR